MTTEVKDQSFLDLVKAGMNVPKKLSDKMHGLDLEAMKMPREVIRRVNALKNNQLKKLDHEVKFFEELQALELKYASLQEPLIEQRRKLVAGDYEPNETEGTWYLDESEGEGSEKMALGDITNANKSNEDNLAKEMKTKVSISEEETAKNVKGIPDFWLHVLQSSGLVSDMIEEHDIPILTYLRDVRVKVDPATPNSYTLEFYFDENEYFTNSVLTKSYDMSLALDPNDPFNFSGPEIFKCTGCTIDWKEGKDVTKSLTQVKQKHKGTGTKRIVNKEEKQDSFFNFFSLPTADGIKPSYKKAMMQTDADKQVAIVKKNDGEEDEEEEAQNLDEELCDADFEIGYFFKEHVIPRAGLYYTGDLDYEDEYSEDEDDDDDEDEDDEDNDMDEDDEDDDEEDSEEDADEDKPMKKSGNKKAKTGDKKPNVNECKQN